MIWIKFLGDCSDQSLGIKWTCGMEIKVGPTGNDI